MLYFLYRHIRLDNNKPFYIGIGRKCEPIQGWHTEYRRAYQKSHRNKYWQHIVSKVGYKVQIMLESDDVKFIKQKEIEFIRLYGRKDFNKGALVNNTSGGDGRLEPNISSMTNVGKNLIPYNIAKKKKVFQYDIFGKFIKEWESMTDAYKSLKVAASSGIIMCCKGKIYYYLNSQWSYVYLGENIGAPKKRRLNAKSIGMYCLKTNKLLKEFTSTREVYRDYGYSYRALSSALTGKSKSSYGYKWKFLN